MNEVFYKKCNERLERISHRMLYVNQAYSVIMQLRNFQEKHFDLMNISPVFYRSVISCSTEVLFIEIYKMYDPRTSSNGIAGLLCTLKKNIHLLDNKKEIEAIEFEELNSNEGKIHRYKNIEILIKESLERIITHEEKIKNLKSLRDKFYAHQDDTINDFDSFFKENAVSLDDLKALILLNVNLFNSLYMYFCDATIYPISINYDDFSKTVYYLEKGESCLKAMEQERLKKIFPDNS